MLLNRARTNTRPIKIENSTKLADMFMSNIGPLAFKLFTVSRFERNYYYKVTF